MQCDNTRCSYWTWFGGRCELKRIAKPGDKVPKRGATSGAKSNRSCGDTPTKAVPCRYTDTKEEVLCIFPFVGENPGQKSGGSSHESCLKTKKGRYWCATKLNLDNRVIRTSVQNRDVDCGQRTNSKKELFCSPPTTEGKQNPMTKSTTKSTTKKPPTTQKASVSKTSCSGRCGKPAALGQCQCNAQCKAFGDCCTDYNTICSVNSANTNIESCSGKCGAKFDRSKKCQCNFGCEKFKNCCEDYTGTCPISEKPKPSSVPTTSSSGKGVSDQNLKAFADDLLKTDKDNVARLVELDTGCTTRVGRPNDCSRNPLFARVDTAIFRKPIYEKLVALYNNYDSDVAMKEDRSRAEQNEEEEFLTEVMKSEVMQKTLTFLKANKLFTKSANDFKKLLKELWFDVYSRGKRILGSSGFEHVFLGEKKGGKVQGFHNWVFFHHLEKNNKVDMNTEKT